MSGFEPGMSQLTVLDASYLRSHLGLAHSESPVGPTTGTLHLEYGEPCLWLMFVNG